MFAIGDRVRTKVMNPSGHTRLPAYLRGRPGVVVWDLGPLPFADARAAGDVAASQRAFTVRFANPDVWARTPTRTAACAPTCTHRTWSRNDARPRPR